MARAGPSNITDELYNQMCDDVRLDDDLQDQRFVQSITVSELPIQRKRKSTSNDGNYNYINTVLFSIF